MSNIPEGDKDVFFQIQSEEVSQLKADMKKRKSEFDQYENFDNLPNKLVSFILLVTVELLILVY